MHLFFQALEKVEPKVPDLGNFSSKHWKNSGQKFQALENQNNDLGGLPLFTSCFAKASFHIRLRFLFQAWNAKDLPGACSLYSTSSLAIFLF